MFFGIHRYAKYSSLWNKKRAVKGASFFTILKGYFSRSQGHKLGYDLATYLLHQSSQFCVVPILNFHVLPLFAFISGRNALIFQNRFVTTTFFRNFAKEMRKSRVTLA